MKTYALYVLDSGQIIQTFSGFDQEDALRFPGLNVPGWGVAEVDQSVSGATHYILDDEFATPFPAQPSPVFTWSWAALQWLDERSILVAQNAKWAQIKAKREFVINSGFESQGHVYDSDTESQGKIQGAILAASLSLQQGFAFSIDWTLADNSVITLSAPEMIQVGMDMLAFINTQHEQGRIKRIEIYSATTVGEVDAITW